MSDLVISCLSQKGGVGKSTIARLVAWTYASAGWSVKIADFNTKQLTSVDWVAARQQAGHTPEISAEPMNSVRGFKREPCDLIVVDGKPDSDNSSLEIARASDLIVIPTGVSLDDLKPQVLFIYELLDKKIEADRILTVLNKVTESDMQSRDARRYLSSAGLAVAETEISAKTSYQIAQNAGLSITETAYPTLNAKADSLAAEIVDKVNQLRQRNAA